MGGLISFTMETPSGKSDWQSDLHHSHSRVQSTCILENFCHNNGGGFHEKYG